MVALEFFLGPCYTFHPVSSKSILYFFHNAADRQTEPKTYNNMREYTMPAIGYICTYTVSLFFLFSISTTISQLCELEPDSRCSRVQIM